MQTKSIATSATGSSWETGAWKSKLLPELKAGLDCVVPACLLGCASMAELVRGGVFVRGFEPDKGDCIGLKIDGETSEFFVHRHQGGFLCIETREANPRRLLRSEEDLTMHRLIRACFYQIMASDLVAGGRPVEIVTGIWEIGRKRLPGKDACKVLFVEQGVPDETVELTVMRDPFNTICLLGCGSPPRHDWHSGKTLIAGVVEVRDGKFISDAFEDLAASTGQIFNGTYIDLDSNPQKLVICGEEFLMVEHRGKSPIGLKYLEHLFDNARESIPVWDLYLAANPGLSEAAFVTGQDDEDEEIDEDAVMTGVKRRQKQHVLRPNWEDEITNTESRKLAMVELTKKRAHLEQLNSKGAAAKRITELEKEIAELESYIGIGKHPTARKRQIKNSDRDKARDSVRNGLDVVINRIAKQNEERAEQLRNSIHQGYEVMFTPPLDWGL